MNKIEALDKAIEDIFKHIDKKDYGSQCYQLIDNYKFEMVRVIGVLELMKDELQSKGMIEM